MAEEGELVAADDRGDVVVVSVRVGAIDGGNAEALRRATLEAAGSSPIPVLLDLEEVELITSVGLGMLVALHTALRRSNRRFGVCGVRGEAAEAIQLAQLNRLFEVCRSPTDFLLRLRTGRTP